MMKKIIYIGSDHVGFELKEELKKYMTVNQIKFIDLGAFNNDFVSYVDIAREVAEKVYDEANTLGVLISGTGVGMQMAANSRRGMRASVCSNEEMAKVARLYHDANVLCLGSKYIAAETAKEILSVFISTNYEGLDAYNKQLKAEPTVIEC